MRLVGGGGGGRWCALPGNDRRMGGAAADGRDVRRPWVFAWGGTAKNRAVVSRRWKLRRTSGGERLYDLETDPKERNPLDLGLPEVQEPLAHTGSESAAISAPRATAR